MTLTQAIKKARHIRSILMLKNRDFTTFCARHGRKNTERVRVKLLWQLENLRSEAREQWQVSI